MWEGMGHVAVKGMVKPAEDAHHCFRGGTIIKIHTQFTCCKRNFALQHNMKLRGLTCRVPGPPVLHWHFRHLFK